MTTATLIKKNMKWNFKNYFLYFASMIFIIMIVYTFNSIQYNEQVLENINTSMTILMEIGAVFIYIFAFIFMWYSNNFFTRNRKNEIGLYSMLGVSKKQISRMLLAENILLGIGALVLGVLLGTMLSKFFVMLLFNLMSKYIDVDFSFSMYALITTGIIFGSFFLILGVHNYMIIYRFKLIEFFNAKNKREKEPKGSAIIAITSLVMLISGYFIAIEQAMKMDFLMYTLVVLILVIVGTYGLFSSFMVFYGKLRRRNRKNLYKNMNLINTSNFIYRIKSNSFVLGSIAILSATAITAAGMSSSFYYQIGLDASGETPYSYAYKMTDGEFDQKVDGILNNAVDHRVIYDETGEVKTGMVGIVIDGEFNDVPMAFISQSTFNKLADFNNLEKINLKAGESLFLVSPRAYSFAKDLKSIQMQNGDKISINEMKQKNVISSISNIYSIVISDDVYENLSDIETVENLRFIEVENENSAQDLTKNLLKIFDERDADSYEYRLESSEMFYNAQMEVRGMLMFVGIFIALVVLISTGSMIYFKLINEAEEEKTRYNIVRKVGASRRDVFKSIYSQMGAMFIFPIIIGLSHASFALGALSKMLKKDLIIPTIVTMAVYVLIYGIYYILTVYKYNKTVNS